MRTRMATATTPTARLTRVPWTHRDMTSRPDGSVPSQCSREGGERIDERSWVL